MNEKQRELLALECVVAVIGGFFAIWADTGHGGALTFGSILIALACLGLVDGSNPNEELNKRRYILMISTGVFWLMTVIRGALTWNGPLSLYLGPQNFVSWIGFFVWALIVSVASRPISSAVLQSFNYGDVTMDRVTKLLKSLALLVGAAGGVWAAVSKFGQSAS
jgi:hypothetical protein